MQTLWSRIAQSRSACRCPQCLQSVHGVGRRATASATQGAPKYWTSSTLWYSGIFAAAATFDAGIKQRRRDQWDQAIAGVKQELGRPLSTSANGAPNERSADSDAAGLNDATSRTQSYDHHIEDDEEDIFEHVEPQRRRSRWPSNTGPALQIYHLPPQSIFADDVVKEKAKMTRWTPKKIETAMLSIDALQLKLVMQLKNHAWEDEAAHAVPSAYRAIIQMPEDELEMSLRLKMGDLLRIRSAETSLLDFVRSSGDLRLCNYHQDSAGSFHQTATNLNRSLQELFQQHFQHSLTTPALLAKVAYNLSISSAPPNVHTWNTLLLGFSRAHSPSVRKVIQSLREVHVRPNEITNEAILRYCIDNDDARMFVWNVNLMRGKYAGLCLARGDIRINEASRGRLVRGYYNPAKIVQLPYPTPNVFGALIQGVLKFNGFDAALTICNNMKEAGWGLCIKGMTPLLEDCAGCGDWKSGLAVWRLMNDLTAQSQRSLWSPPEKIALGTYATMLRLCVKCDEQLIFDDVMKGALTAHRQSRKRLMGIVKARSAAAERRKKNTEAPASAADLPSHVHDDHENIDLIDAEMQHGWDDTMPRRHAEYQRRGTVTSQHREMHTIRECKTSIIRNASSDRESPSDLEPHDSVPDREDSPRVKDGADSTSETRQESNASTSTPSSQHTLERRTKPPVLTREQLDGLLPPSDELDDYELCERPMTKIIAAAA